MTNLVKVVGVRVSEDLHSKLVAVSHARGEDVGDFIREAILKEPASLSFLSEKQKKALRLQTKGA